LAPIKKKENVEGESAPKGERGGVGDSIGGGRDLSSHRARSEGKGGNAEVRVRGKGKKKINERREICKRKNIATGKKEKINRSPPLSTSEEIFPHPPTGGKIQRDYRLQGGEGYTRWEERARKKKPSQRFVK